MIEQAQKDNGRFEVETDDIRFRKLLEQADDTIAEVRYEIRSRAGDPLACRVRDRLAGGMTDEDLYLHPGAENWTVEADGTVMYEGPLAPGRGTSATVSIRLDSLESLGDLETEPTIDIARPKDGPPPRQSDAHSASPDSGQTVQSRSDGGEPPASVPIEIDDPTVDVADSRAPEEEGHRENETNTGSMLGSSGSVVQSLVDELESGSVSDDELESLRSALGSQTGSADARYNSIRAKIDRLQTDIGDLLAYRDALEEFIDVHGSGTDIIEDLKTGLDSVESRLDSIDDRLGDLEIAVDESDDRIEGLQAEISSLATMRDDLNTLQTEYETTITEHGDKLSALATQMGSIDRQLDRQTAAIQSDIEDITDELDEAREFRDSLGDALSG